MDYFQVPGPSFLCETSRLEKYNCKCCHFEADLIVLLKNHVRKCHSASKIQLELSGVDDTIRCYVCKKCTLETHSSLIWCKHRRENCSRKLHRTAFNKFQNAARFKRMRPTTEWLKCGQCSFKSKRDFILQHHFKTRHLTANAANQRQQSNGDDRPRISVKNIKLSSDGISYECPHPECDHHTRHKSSLRSHILFKHTPKEHARWYTCEQCSYQTKQASTLKEHKLRRHTEHSAIKWHHCPHCPHKCKMPRDLTKHDKLFHAAEPVLFTCDRCPYSSRRKDTLENHKNSKHGHVKRDPIRRFSCKFCAYKAKTPSCVKEHELALHLDVSFKCDQCAYVAKWRSHLRTHKIYKHLSEDEIQWHRCHECQHRFKTKSDLKQHRNSLHPFDNLGS